MARHTGRRELEIGDRGGIDVLRLNGILIFRHFLKLGRNAAAFNWVLPQQNPTEPLTVDRHHCIRSAEGCKNAPRSARRKLSSHGSILASLRYDNA